MASLDSKKKEVKASGSRGLGGSPLHAEKIRNIRWYNFGVLPQEAVYIKQLGATKENLKADLSLNKVQTTSDKHHQEIMGKNNLIRSLQENIKTLEVQVESVQTNFDQVKDDYMTLEVEAALSSNEEETKELKDKLNQLENDCVGAR
ncbi:uncharacterized protein EV154DRAFT_549008 [Mucor mucedo]|uniref:uncharacterized protein n=1 Tax=Mucor mucedo TaxID=29922 RepID=UPI0022204A49|nr:uncharacterized protein EV154DRAFT_549008 [Mucor mucedo]KAI7894597.1 hypothetical protein EV154DRAFT_549008 [Mucor mucedo]